MLDIFDKDRAYYDNFTFSFDRRNNLNVYFHAERNESFHARLPLLEKENLIEYEVDTTRTITFIEEIEKMCKSQLN